MAENPARELFIWKEDHERAFIRELLLIEPYMHKVQSKERGQAWKMITENLNALHSPRFRVTVRSVRDKFNKMLDMFRKKEAEEARASGITGIEYTEVYRGMTDISQRIQEAKTMWDEESNKEKEKAQDERHKAEDMRRKATESLGQTRKRKETEEGEGASRQKRRSTDLCAIAEENLKFKRESAEKERKLREEEIEDRRQAREINKQMAESQQQFYSKMQIQQQEFMLAMQQQNLQALETMKEIISSLKNNK